MTPRGAGAALVGVLVLLGAAGWAIVPAVDAGRTAHRIEASGVAPYAPDGWVADGTGSAGAGRLSYAMHDHTGQHVAVTVQRPASGTLPLEPYQEALLRTYGVVIDIRALHDTDPDGMVVPSAIGAAMAPRGARWLADRACWSCRLVGHLVDAGAVFG